MDRLKVTPLTVLHRVITDRTNRKSLSQLTLPGVARSGNEWRDGWENADGCCNDDGDVNGAVGRCRFFECSSVALF